MLLAGFAQICAVLVSRTQDARGKANFKPILLVFLRK